MQTIPNFMNFLLNLYFLLNKAKPQEKNLDILKWGIRNRLLASKTRFGPVCYTVPSIKLERVDPKIIEQYPSKTFQKHLDILKWGFQNWLLASENY